MSKYWTVTDEKGLVHSLHTYPASAQATRRWLVKHHPKFYENWAVISINRTDLPKVRWLP